jgi:hypothetical protein
MHECCRMRRRMVEGGEAEVAAVRGSAAH